MRIEEQLKLDFDDVLLRPKRSESPSRNAVDLIRKFKCLHGGEFTCLPIAASNMSATGTLNGPWVQLHTIGRTDFLTADEICLFGNEYGNAYNAGCHFLHWEES